MKATLHSHVGQESAERQAALALVSGLGDCDRAALYSSGKGSVVRGALGRGDKSSLLKVDFEASQIGVMKILSGTSKEGSRVRERKMESTQLCAAPGSGWWAKPWEDTRGSSRLAVSHRLAWKRENDVHLRLGSECQGH